jgi:hypothetical protein
MTEILFSGISVDKWERDRHQLVPKAIEKPFRSSVCCGDPRAVCGFGAELGQSAINELIAHQWPALNARTSGISTTPHRERALAYATRNGQRQTGIVGHIDVGRLRASGARAYVVNRLLPISYEPKDDEVVVVAADFGALPPECIVRVERYSMSRARNRRC